MAAKPYRAADDNDPFLKEARREAARIMGSASTYKKRMAVRENGKKGGRPVTWVDLPTDGLAHPDMVQFRYTITRKEDQKIRFTNRRPRSVFYESDLYLVWDNWKGVWVEAKPKPKQKRRKPKKNRKP